MCNKVNGVGILKVCNKNLILKYYMVKMHYSAFYEAGSTSFPGMDDGGSIVDMDTVFLFCFLF